MIFTQPFGYLASPSTGQGPAVLVLHAWWGVNDTLKVFCDQLAQAGFVAFAPDLYNGKVAKDIPEAEALSSALFENLDQPRASLAAAIQFLTGHSSQTQPGSAVIGFSLGAFFALDISVNAPEHVRSVVIFYGTRPGDYSSSRADYLGHFAETDQFEPQSEVDSLEESLRRANRPVTFHHYKGTGHWFFEPDISQAYNPTAAGLAWDRTLAFLRSSFNI